jgi:hypothetical protein
MALFGSIGKAFERVISNPVVQVLFPPFALANLGALKGIAALTSVASPHAPTPSQVSHADQTHVFFEQTPQAGNIPQAYAPSSSYGGYQDPFANQPYGGPSSWDYSIPSPTALTTRYQTSPVAQGLRTWEDLTAGAALFL